MGRGGGGARLSFPNVHSKSNDDNRFNTFSSMITLNLISHVFIFELYAVHVYENQISGVKNRRTGNSRIVEILNPKKLI